MHVGDQGVLGSGHIFKEQAKGLAYGLDVVCEEKKISQG